MAKKYNYIPGLAEWEKDTTVDEDGGKKDDREKDTLLRGIDIVIEAYGTHSMTPADSSESSLNSFSGSITG